MDDDQRVCPFSLFSIELVVSDGVEGIAVVYNSTMVFAHWAGVHGKQHNTTMEKQR